MQYGAYSTVTFVDLALKWGEITAVAGRQPGGYQNDTSLGGAVCLVGACEWVSMQRQAGLLDRVAPCRTAALARSLMVRPSGTNTSSAVVIFVAVPAIPAAHQLS
jgi:hypothetical protein